MTKEPSYEERWANALLEQHRYLFDQTTKQIKPEFREHTRCPACNDDHPVPFFEKDWFKYVKCQNCSMVYMTPRLNKAANQAFYNSRLNEIYNETKFDIVSESTKAGDLTNLENLQLLDKVRGGEKGILLEIGSAKGYFLSKARELGYEIHGLELNKRNYEYSQSILGNTILNMDLLDTKFESAKFDVVYMRDVIEHIADPGPILQEIRRITKIGGVLFIQTHNIEGWIHKIVRQRHTVIFGFEHPNHWSPQSLKYALEKHGYFVELEEQTALDFTICRVLGYFIEPTFTTILPKRTNRLIRILVALLRFPFCVNPLKWLDQHLLPKIAIRFGGGSEMKIMARKFS
jgi:2-polyprenyl-3-methyl-5-hydroxy-6-metoxy-1,4-benzoquinol methylase